MQSTMLDVCPVICLRGTNTPVAIVPRGNPSFWPSDHRGLNVGALGTMWYHLEELADSFFPISGLHILDDPRNWECTSQSHIAQWTPIIQTMRKPTSSQLARGIPNARSAAISFAGQSISNGTCAAIRKRSRSSAITVVGTFPERESSCLYTSTDIYRS